MTDKQNFENKATFINGHELLTGKKTKYEFVKQDFEKDINVPSKQIIIDGIEVSGCELYRDDNGVFAPDGTAERTELCYLTNDYCGNNPSCYYKQLKRAENQIVDLNKMVEAKEQECETLASQLDFEVQKKECLEQKCKQQSWDIGNLGYKIKNQRHEINNRLKQLDQLKVEQNKIKTICDNHFDEYEMGCLDLSDAIESLLERYDNAITGLTKQRKELKAENDLLRQHKKSKQASYESMQQQWNEVELENRRLKAESKEINEKLKEKFSEYTLKSSFTIAFQDNLLNKYKQTLTEIKEIAEHSILLDCNECPMEDWCEELCSNENNFQEVILQKISEVENETINN